MKYIYGGHMSKLKSTGFALLYFAIPICVQLAMGFQLAVQIFILRFNGSGSIPASVLQRFQDDYRYNLILVTLCNLVLVMGVGTWYWFIRRRENKDRKNVRKILSGKSLACMAGLAVCGQFLCNVIMMFFASVFPDTYQNYSKLMEGVDIHVLPVWAMLFIVVVWAPLAEELVFRGMIFRTLRKGFCFLPAALFSGLAFGVYHMNVVQGVYGAAFGVLLAFVYEKTNSLLGCYVFHFMFNLTNYLLGWLQNVVNLPDYVMGLIILTMDALSVGGMILFILLFSKIYKEKKKPEQTAVSEGGENNENI